MHNKLNINIKVPKLNLLGSSVKASPNSTFFLQDKINANVKNFDIEHPTKKEPWRLRYSVLEGPEIGVFVRGENKDTKIIELPYYWNDLVFENSLTVNLTPIGSPSIK